MPTSNQIVGPDEVRFPNCHDFQEQVSWRIWSVQMKTQDGRRHDHQQSGIWICSDLWNSIQTKQILRRQCCLEAGGRMIIRRVHHNAITTKSSYFLIDNLLVSSRWQKNRYLEVPQDTLKYLKVPWGTSKYLKVSQSTQNVITTPPNCQPAWFQSLRTKKFRCNWCLWIAAVQIVQIVAHCAMHRIQFIKIFYIHYLDNFGYNFVLVQLMSLDSIRYRSDWLHRIQFIRRVHLMQLALHFLALFQGVHWTKTCMHTIYIHFLDFISTVRCSILH